MLPCVFSVVDHRRRQNVARTSVIYSAIASCATFLFLPHFDVICDLLLNRRTATWNLFVKFIIAKNKLMSVFNTSALLAIDHEFRHNIVKVVCRSTRLSPRGST